jgi:hypothetical protein
MKEDRRSIAPMAASLGCAVVFGSLSLLTAEEMVRAEAPHPPEPAPFVPQTGVGAVSIGSNTAAVGPGFFTVYDTSPQPNREARRHPGGLSASFAAEARWTVSFDRIPPAAPMPSPGLAARLRDRRR